MTRPPHPSDETLIDPEWTPGPDRHVVVEERPPPPPPPPRRLPRLWPWLLALLVLALAAVGAAFWLSREDDEDETAPATTQTVARVEVPVLVGVREPRALELLREAGLQGDVARRAGNKPAGVVVEQDPEGGVRVEEGESVRLVVSRGPARETVPDLVGEQLNQALDDLRAAGFDSEVRQVFAEEESGVVVKQEPAAGAKLKDGATVALQVSKGPKPVPIPDVVGQQASEATAVLRDAGFEVNIVTVPSREPSGTVVAQNPTAGTLPEPGTTVRLNVAQDRGQTTTGTTTGGTTTGGTTTGRTTTGRTTTGQTQPPPPPAGPATVPDVVGLTQAQATKALHDEGLKPSFQFVPSQQDPEGTVVAQAKPGGTTLQRGDAVGVNVSVGPEQVPLVAVPDTVGASEADARSRLETAGFRVQVLREVTEDPAQVGLVVDQQPGRRAPEGALVTIYIGRR